MRQVCKDIGMRLKVDECLEKIKPEYEIILYLSVGLFNTDIEYKNKLRTTEQKSCTKPRVGV